MSHPSPVDKAVGLWYNGRVNNGGKEVNAPDILINMVNAYGVAASSSAISRAGSLYGFWPMTPVIALNNIGPAWRSYVVLPRWVNPNCGKKSA